FDLASRRLAADGGLTWPPNTDYLVGVEVKCAYFTDVIHAAKSGKKLDIRKQLEGLQIMGFDRVVLLDIIANEPVSGVGIQARLNASSRAHDATERMRSVLNDRITSGAAVDHFALSIGAVTGGEENLQGCGQPTLLHRGPPNFHGGDRNQISNRDTMN